MNAAQGNWNIPSKKKLIPTQGNPKQWKPTGKKTKILLCLTYIILWIFVNVSPIIIQKINFCAILIYFVNKININMREHGTSKRNFSWKKKKHFEIARRLDGELSEWTKLILRPKKKTLITKANLWKFSSFVTHSTNNTRNMPFSSSIQAKYSSNSFSVTFVVFFSWKY